MKFAIPPVLFAFLMFLGMVLFLELGRQVGLRRRPGETEGERGSFGIVEGALFALFGLLMAFTFSGAANRFNEKRMLIAEEINTIGTAYLRVQLLSPEAQSPVRELFRQYVDSRLETYRKLPDMHAAEAIMAQSKKLQQEIWNQAVAASRLPNSHPNAGFLLLPALNNMFDMATTRTMALQNHPPGIIYVLLFILGLICSALAGYRMALSQHRSWLHVVGFTVMTVTIVYVVLDIEYPRAGLIRLADSEQMMIEVRREMD